MVNKMGNIEILECLGMLGDVRERLGADDDKDTSMDDEINKLDSVQLVQEWSGWSLGSGHWAKDIIYNYNEIERLKKED